jgi:hypothetical protein
MMLIFEHSNGISRWLRVTGAVAVLVVTGSSLSGAQTTTVTADRVQCVPAGANAVVQATVVDNQPDTRTRLFFRRMNDVVEDLYFVEMYPDGEGRYWAVMPKAEKRKLDRHEIVRRRDEAAANSPEAIWWREKQASDDRNPTKDLDQAEITERASVGKTEQRDWMNTLNDQQFEQWLDTLEYEPVEYFAAVFGPTGDLIARSPMMIGEVRSESDCHVELTPEQQGEAQNLVVGETAAWQRGRAVFHWLCDGVVARVNSEGVKRPDETCRTCVPCINQATVLNYTVGGAVSPSDF